MFFVFAIVILLYLIIAEPIIRKKEYEKFISNLKFAKINALSRYYRNDALRNWLQVAAVFIMAYFCHFTVEDFGFRHLNFTAFYAFPLWIKIIACLLITFYIVDLYIIPCCLSRFNKRMKTGTANVLAQMKHLDPSSAREYFWWWMHVLNAITEELMYRGFLFLVLPLLLPGIPLLVIFLVSAIFDSLRFYPRPVIARFVFFSAICLSVLYIACGSLYVPIFISLMRYLKKFVLPWSYVTDQDQMKALGFIPMKGIEL